MSLWTEITAAGEEIEEFLTNISIGAKKLYAVYQKLSPSTLAAVAAVSYDVIKAFAAGTAIVADVAAGNVTGAVTIAMSDTTKALVTQFVTDLKAGEAVTVADADALGIKL